LSWQPEADLQEVLLTEAQIKTRVAEMARQITRDYDGRQLLLIGILKGAVMFLADLVRELGVKASIDFIAVSSYGSSTKSSGAVRILKDLDSSIDGKDVLVVEDIVDTGLTLQYLVNTLKARKPRSLKMAALLDKPSRRKVDVNVDYLGFQIPDKFVVGYGLDFNEDYRHLPYVAVLKPELYREVD